MCVCVCVSIELKLYSSPFVSLSYTHTHAYTQHHRLFLIGNYLLFKEKGTPYGACASGEHRSLYDVLVYCMVSQWVDIATYVIISLVR
jgi:hypothetical protein